MEANELRIGNFFIHINRANNIHLPETNNIQKVLTIGFDVESIDYIKVPAQVEKWNKYKATDIAPIPLTEEWLLKFGFEKKRHAYDKGLSSISMPSDGVLSWKNGRAYFNSWKISDAPKYVHQLQNLYFALMGTELKINP